MARGGRDVRDHTGGEEQRNARRGGPASRQVLTRGGARGHLVISSVCRPGVKSEGLRRPTEGGAAMRYARFGWLGGVGPAMGLAVGLMASPSSAQTAQEIAWCENISFRFSPD